MWGFHLNTNLVSSCIMYHSFKAGNLTEISRDRLFSKSSVSVKSEPFPIHFFFLHQYPNDLLLNESDSSRMTDIVDVKLYNPVTKRLVNVGALDTPAVFLIPLKTGVTFPNESYVEVSLEVS